MTSFALAAIGRDRPGIVAAIAEVLFENGCNVEDSSMSLLRGNFAMMLVFAAPDDATPSALEGALRPACEAIDVTFSVLPVDDRARPPQPSHVVTVYGADKPGILARFSAALSEANVNITDLSSRLVGDSAPVYALQIEIEVPAEASQLEGRLKELAADVGVDVALQPYDADLL